MSFHTVSWQVARSVVVALLFLLGSQARAVPLEEIPSPRPEGWVTDLTGQLQTETIDELNRLIEEAHQERGLEIAVVLISSTQGADHRAYATDLFNLWGIGDRQLNNGILLFAAVDDRAAELVLGSGIDSRSEERIAEDIMQAIILPGFREGDSGKAMLGAAQASIERILKPALDLTLRQRVMRSLRNVAAQLMTLFAVLAGAAFFVIRRALRFRTRSCPSCSSPMVRLDETADDQHLGTSEQKEEELRSVDWDVWLCARCHEVKKLRYRAWFTRYATCPDCRAVTLHKAKSILRQATYSSAGLAKITESCQNCDYRNTYTKSIPRKTRSSSSGSSSGFSGGRSSGGGASGRW